jgi:hypothetical protein
MYMLCSVPCRYVVVKHIEAKIIKSKAENKGN